MAIPESQLETWSHQGSITQSSDTYATVRKALLAEDAKYAGKNFEVFLQGSYGNDTNIYAESDVDVVIRLDSTYYYDTSLLNPQDLQLFQAQFSPASYVYPEFKGHVIEALQKSFGKNDVVPGTKAVKIKANNGRRNADVVVAAQFRKYYSQPLGGATYVPGICFFTSSGIRIENYPKHHSFNCTAKHKATNQWFKPMVRILKNVRGRLVAEKMIESGTAPSYFLEGLLHNVPNEKFGTSYEDTFVAAINWIIESEKQKLICANQQHYLVRDGFAQCWPCSNCDTFLKKVVELWKNW